MSQKLSQFLSQPLQQFLVELHQRFENRRQTLMQNRREREKLWSTQTPEFLKATPALKNSEWSVAPAPGDLQKRHVEITGPAEPKMIINALNSGADVFMADFEDSLAPRIDLLIAGQEALSQAVRKNLTFQSGDKKYRLKDSKTTLVVRPRGWHLSENHFLIDGTPMAAGLFDFGIFFFNNAQELVKRGSGPYFYLPKMESHLEARLWADVFRFSETSLNIKPSTVRATVLIETLPAAFEMEEILFELKDYASGLNAGRWDYIFSYIKKMKSHPFSLLPDRAQVTMTTPFLQSYCELLVQTCHRRKAHAMGGMSAFIPNRQEPEITQNALEKVKADKAREVNLGFDGTWVAHPDLISLARKEFEKVLSDQPHQKKVSPIRTVLAQDLFVPHISSPTVTEDGVRNNINVSLLYLDRWLSGTGAAALYNLMEDAATAEISRSQLWQWLERKVVLTSGEAMTPEIYRRFKDEEIKKINSQFQTTHLDLAEKILDGLVLATDLADFLTLQAYAYLVEPENIFNVSAKNFLQGVKSYESTTV